MNTAPLKEHDPNDTSTPQEEVDEETRRYEHLIATVMAGYKCNRGKARRIIKSLLRKSAKKLAKQKKVL